MTRLADALADGEPREVRYADVRRATVAVEFRQPPAEELRALGASRSANDPGDVGEVAEEHK